ncbi:MAG: glycine--tRNA ligase subunit beta [Deltaproteobacteria bacterium]|nr:glycine--tRNA ligase subunit beta [Deltaproteobacteria bacterium]MCL5879761.1 glycine--tRNA ligase subunit beta [Deltaproteobacteria bacterium]
MSEYLLEIGSGELPYGEVKAIPAALSDRLQDFFAKDLLLPEKPDIQSFSTPRRVVVFIKRLPLRTLDRETEIIGPPLSISYQGDMPALPLIQFMKKNGILNHKKLYVINQKRGPYVAYKKIIKGGLLKDLLSENIPNIIKNLPFKKSMFWLNKDVRYPRPVLWILSLFDGKPLRFYYGDVKAADYTYLIRKGSYKTSYTKVNNSKDYFKLLSSSGIILENERRRLFIEKELRSIAEKLKLDIAEYEDDFMDEIVGLTETPHAIAGNFDKKFLAIPEELLSIVMRKHQRFFPLKNKDGLVKNEANLASSFIGISNIPAWQINKNKEEIERDIRSGYSKVLGARLADADFFYKEDIKHPLSYFTEKTKNILFYEGLGTYADKTERIKKLGLFIAKKYNFTGQDALQFNRAANLLKFDLATHVVYEFPEMQGIAGKIYAKKAKEEEAVCLAIEEHYYPLVKAKKRILPSNDLSALCSLSDKFDTIFSFVMLKRLPTGESDPFYLRRAAIGIIEIILEKKYIIRMEEVFDFYFDNFFKERKLNLNELKASFINFTNTRFKNFLISLPSGYKPDVIASVVREDGACDFYTSYLKIDFISKHKLHEELYELSQAYKRINNITLNYGNILDFDIGKLTLPDEIHLYKTFEAVQRDTVSFLKKNDYYKVMNHFYTLVKPINDFFDGVLVLTDDAAVRNSRLGLLNNILNLLKNLCDFSSLSY